MIRKIIALWRQASSPSPPPSAGGDGRMPLCDTYGNIHARIVSGNPTPFYIGGYQLNSDNNSPTTGIETIGYLLGFDGTNWDRIRALADNADGQAPAGIGALLSLARSQEYYPTSGTWHRRRGNYSEVILPSATRNSTTTSANLRNYNARGGHIILTVTSSVERLQLFIEGYNQAGNNWYTILQSPDVGIPDTGTFVFKVYPGIPPVVGWVSNDVLPDVWRVRVVHFFSVNATYSVGVNYIV